MFNFRFLSAVSLFFFINSAFATIKMSIEKIISEHQTKTIIFKLTDLATNKPVQLSDLGEVHTQKIHLLVIDDSLSDYSHIHPQQTAEPGVYFFKWQPKIMKANYRVWADLMPLTTNQQTYAIADLYKSKLQASEISMKPTNTAIVGDYKFNLTFEAAKLQQGKATKGKIEISDLQGNAVLDLEPIMGAYAHLVGFSEDLKSVVHVHPMGTEPKNKSDRGGPELVFHIQPHKGGFVKFFAQVKIKGKDYFAPFGLIVGNKG
ncbi:MAG: hypothetical protein H0U70_02160 [Tatlockia sp.]|nr:hypothetical protein [Tatlockia sp.]